MKWIGLTGSLGSGKSTVAEIIRSRGFAVVDADQFARDALLAGSLGEAQVFKKFGENLKTPDGKLDRRRLAALVFDDAKQLKELEMIVHPIVQSLTKKKREELEKASNPIAFYDVPLLFEQKMEPLFDGIVVVHAPLELCVARVQKRSNLTRFEIEARLKQQVDVARKIARSHWQIENAGTLAELAGLVEGVLQDIGRKFSIPG
jgi:dephospho-CoA kinase